MQKKLTGLSRSVTNPNVEMVCDQLKTLLQDENSRALIFVSARSTCKALASYLDKKLSPAGATVRPFYGKDTRAGVDGM